MVLRCKLLVLIYLALSVSTLSLAAQEPRPELVVQSGHSGAVLAATFSPDGKTLASGSADKTLKLWDVASGRALRTLAGNSSAVKAVIFSPDGKTLASFGVDDDIIKKPDYYTVKLWDVASGSILRTLSGHNSFIESVSFSPDGKRLASWSDDKTFRLWEVASGKLLQTLSVTPEALKGVAFSPDGKTCAGIENGDIRLFDQNSVKEIRVLTDSTSSLSSLIFSPDGRRAYFGQDERYFRLMVSKLFASR